MLLCVVARRASCKGRRKCLAGVKNIRRTCNASFADGNTRYRTFQSQYDELGISAKENFKFGIHSKEIEFARIVVVHNTIPNYSPVTEAS